MAIEFAILDGIQARLQCGFLDAAMPLVTKLGNGGVLWILLTVLFLAVPKTRRIGAAMALSLAVEALCCNVLIKPLAARIRPFDVRTGITLLIAKPTDFSFPSGHTGAAFATVSAMFFAKDRRWIPAGVLAVLIAFSRLYLYVHYPTDVLAGALIGILTGWLANAFLLRIASAHGRNES